MQVCRLGSKQTLPTQSFHQRTPEIERNPPKFNLIYQVWRILAIQNQSNEKCKAVTQVLNSKRWIFLKSLKIPYRICKKFSSTFQVPVIQLKDILQKSIQPQFYISTEPIEHMNMW